MSDASKAVFLSYASQDAEAAKRICEALRAAGIEVWFDQNELVGGDAWDAKIRKQIKECALFVPIISANTQARGEGYFRLEWKLGVDRSHLIAHDQPFLLPVVIDDTPDAAARVPVEFKQVQWTRLRPSSFAEATEDRLGFGGQARIGSADSLDAFCERVGKLLAPEGVAGVARVSRPVQTVTTTSPVTTGQETRATAGGRWRYLAVAAVLAVFAGFAFVRREKTAAAVPPPATSPAQPARDFAEAKSPVDAKSLVVLPLENLSPDPENAFFTDGIHTEIIETLTRLSDLKVIRRASALAFQGSRASLAEIAEKLGVSNVITGSVRREKDRVRISLELRRASDEAVLWGPQVYDREVKEVFAIQTEIAGEVARVLQARERKGMFAGAEFMAKDPQIYEQFIRLRREYEGALGQDLAWAEKCIELAHEILRAEPTFMPAASRLSLAHTWGARLARDTSARARHASEAKRWGETASRLVAGGAGDGALAFYYATVESDYGRGLAYAEKMVRALPNDASGHNFAFIALRGLGRAAEAEAALQRALGLDPLNPILIRNRLGYLALMRRLADFDREVIRGRSLAADSALDLVTVRFSQRGELPAIPVGPAEDHVRWLSTDRQFAAAFASVEAELQRVTKDDVLRLNLLVAKCDLLRRMGRMADVAGAAREAQIIAERLQSAEEVGPTEKPWWRAMVLARTGDTEGAITAARLFVSAASESNQPRERQRRGILLAELHAYLGQTRECVDLLAKLLRVPSGITVPMLKVDPVWDNVREDAGFKALLADPKNSEPL